MAIFHSLNLSTNGDVFLEFTILSIEYRLCYEFSTKVKMDCSSATS